MPRYTKQQVTYWLGMLQDGEIDLHDDNIGLAGAALEYLEGLAQPELLPPGYLTPHFTLEEMIRSGTAASLHLDNMPTLNEQANLTDLCKVLEIIRTNLGDKPITITSAFRSEAVNQAVGGVPNSAHRQGLAADFVCPTFGTPQEIAKFLQPHMKALGLDQLIYENKGGAQWVHVGLSSDNPRYQALTITDSGTTVGIA